MDVFLGLFGVKAETLRRNCIIIPADGISAFAGIAHTSKGKGLHYSVVSTPCFSVITARFNILTGDCVLRLKGSPCRNLFVFGSCGGLSSRKIGDKVIIEEALNMESFSDMLNGRESLASEYPDKDLTAKLAAFAEKDGFAVTKCATVNSLFLEESYLPFFKKRGIDCLDMEASAVFSAAKHAGIKAAAAFYVADTVEGSPFYTPLPKTTQELLWTSKKTAAETLAEFIKNECR